jgi:hypothetical protein
MLEGHPTEKSQHSNQQHTNLESFEEEEENDGDNKNNKNRNESEFALAIHALIHWYLQDLNRARKRGHAKGNQNSKKKYRQCCPRDQIERIKHGTGITFIDDDKHGMGEENKACQSRCESSKRHGAKQRTEPQNFYFAGGI